MIQNYTEAEITSLQTMNKDYNITIADTLSLLAGMSQLGFSAVSVVAVPTSQFSIATSIPVSILIGNSIRQDVPINIEVQFGGTRNYHNLAQIRRRFQKYDPISAYNQVFYDVYGGRDQWGRTSANWLLDIPVVSELVKKQVVELLGSSIASVKS